MFAGEATANPGRDKETAVYRFRSRAGKYHFRVSGIVDAKQKER